MSMVNEEALMQEEKRTVKHRGWDHDAFLSRTQTAKQMKISFVGDMKQKGQSGHLKIYSFQ